MKEPRPWTEEGATEIEQALLHAGRSEAPCKGADLRILAAMREPAAPPVRPATLTRWTKVGLIAVVAAGAAVTSHQLARPHVASPSVTPADLSDTVPMALPDAASVPDKAAKAPESSEALSLAPEERQPRGPGNGRLREQRSATTGRIREVPPRPNDSPPDHSLGDEIKALDRAREAMDASRASDVLRLLDEYRRGFPQGRLRSEAMILRLHALVMAGRHDDAKALASRLLADPAYQPYVVRIQSLLRETKK